MSVVLERWGRYAARHPWRTIGAWVVLTLVVVTSAATLGRDLERTTGAPGMDSQVAADLLEEAGLDEGGMTADVVATPRGGGTFADSPAARAQLAQLRGDVLALPHVREASDPLADDAGPSPEGLSPDGRVALIGVQYAELRELTASDLERLMGAAEDAREASPALQLEVGGALAWEFGEASSGTTELVGLGVAAVILLMAFGSVLAAGVPLVAALVGLAVGMTGLGLVTRVVEIPDVAPVMAAMVGIGVGIDYALFLLTRHREGLAAGLDVPDAAGRAVATAGSAVVIAGGTVVVSILGMAVAGLPFLTAIGVAIAFVVLLMVATAVTLVPALLGLAGHRLARGRRGRPARGLPSARWHRWGAHVGRHRWPWAVGAAVVLIALAAPVLALRLGTPDLGTYPAERTERRAYDLVTEGFGPGATGPMLVVVDTAGDPTAADAAAAAVARDPGVASVSPPGLDAASGIARFAALPASAPNDPEAREAVLRLRSEVLPGALSGGPASAHVGGQTAVLADLSDRVQERLPWFLVAVVLLSLVPLTLLFRSVVLPLKAAAMNLLSIGAAYGVLVMVFQWGWGASLIGVDAPVPIISFIPLMMFAVVFGLSMDYEVFLLSRVREAWLRTGDPDAAVVEGLAATGRTITAAAAIMVAVFTGFALAPDPTVTMMGLGLATAIAIDATIVRLVLVPATMRILGRANWWLPAWLDRVLPHLDAPAQVIAGSRTDRPRPSTSATSSRNQPVPG